MRKTIGLMAIGLMLSVGRAYAQEEADVVAPAATDELSTRRAMAEEILNLMNMKEGVEKSFAMIKQMIPAQMAKMNPATGRTDMSSNVSSQQNMIVDMITQEFRWDKIKDDYISLYAETFTADEMKGVITFYRSPAGQAFTKKQPELMKRSVEMSQRMMMQLMPKIQAMTKELSKTPPPTTDQALEEVPVDMDVDNDQ